MNSNFQPRFCLTPFQIFLRAIFRLSPPAIRPARVCYMVLLSSGFSGNQRSFRSPIFSLQSTPSGSDEPVQADCPRDVSQDIDGPRRDLS